MPSFNLFFFYKNRSKIRNSFFLESISSRLKSYILFHYKEDNYILLDNLLRVCKILVFSLIYIIIILSVDFNKEVLQAIAYVVFGFMGFFVGLISLSYNRESLKGVENDHYFRMLSEKRNELLKQIALRRINYGFLNWVIPFSFPLFLYAAIFTSFHFFIQYIVLLSLYYLLLFIFVFLTQKLLFSFLKKTVLISDILIYIFAASIVGLPFLFYILMLLVSEMLSDYVGDLTVFTSLSVLLIFTLWNLKKYLYKSTFNYSITNTLLVGTKKIYKENRLKKPPIFVRLFYGKDDFSNLVLTKDLLSFYRKDKRETFSLIFVSLISFGYSAFLISALQSGDAITSIVPIDNIILSVIMIFFIISHYRFKDVNWVSSEGKNLELFRRLDHQALNLYKSKLKLNAIILLPMILLYAITPMFFILSYNHNALLYVLIRPLVILIYALLLLEYPLINDARKSLIKKYRDLLYMRAGDIVMFIFFVQGIGLSVLLTFISENSYLSQHTYIFWLVITLIFIVMVLIKIRFLYIRRSLEREEA